MEIQDRDVPSFQEVLARVHRLRLGTEVADPSAPQALAYLQAHAGDILRRLRTDASLRATASQHFWHNGETGYDLRLLQDGWRITALFRGSPGGEAHGSLNAMSAEWADRQEERERLLFNERTVTGQGRDEHYSVEALASVLQTQPVTAFEAKRAFDPSGVVDALGQGLDTNVVELVRLLNVIGVRTTSSCGGHPGHRRPYLHVVTDDLEIALSLLQAWRAQGGLPYRIVPGGSPATEVRIKPPPDVSLEDAQADLDSLTDFLRRGLPEYRYDLTLPELQHRARRETLRKAGM